MRKSAIIIAILAITMLLAGCDLFASLFPGVSYEDLVGEWDFPSVLFNNEQTGAVHLSILPKDPDGNINIDLSLHDFTSFFYGQGTMNGNIFTGTYNGDDGIIHDYHITIKFTLRNDKLKAEFSGEGPLYGLVLENGVPSLP